MSGAITSRGTSVPDLSVVLPTYNEAGHIVRLVSRIGAAVESANVAYEILLVDDDSPDGTAGVVEREFGADPRVRIVRRLADRGLPRSIGAGIGLSTGRSVAVLDSDFNHDPALIPTMLGLLRACDLVIGSRYVRGGAMPDPRRYWASYAFNFLIRALVRTGVHDNLSGYFVAPGEWLRSIQEETVFYGYGDYFIRLVALAKRNGAKIVEIPVVYGLRPTGTSKTDLIRTPMRYFAAALRLAVGWDRPRLRAPSPTALAH